MEKHVSTGIKCPKCRKFMSLDDCDETEVNGTIVAGSRWYICECERAPYVKESIYISIQTGQRLTYRRIK